MRSFARVVRIPRVVRWSHVFFHREHKVTSCGNPKARSSNSLQFGANNMGDHEHVEKFGRVRVATITEDDFHVDENVVDMFGHAKKEQRKFKHLTALPKQRQFWRNGVLHRSKRERKVTWNELFYDLAFVVAFHIFGHQLQQEPTIEQFGEFVLIFLAIWQTWQLTTRYMNQFCRDYDSDLITKTFIFTQMIAVAGMAANSTHAVSGNTSSSMGFAISLTFSRVSVGLLYLLIYNNHKDIRLNIRLDIGIHCITIALFLVGGIASIGTALRCILWSLGMAADIVLRGGSIIIFRFIPKRFFPNYQVIAWNIEHISERVGLFTIITIGELLLVAIVETNGVHSWQGYTAMFAALLLAVELQWIYFDVQCSPFSFVRHAFRRHWFSGFGWIYIHVPLQTSVIAGSAGCALLIRDAIFTAMQEEAGNSEHLMARATEFEELHPGGRWFACGGFAVSLLCIAVLGMLHQSSPNLRISWKIRVAFRIFMACVLALLPTMGSSASSVAYLLAIDLCLGIVLIVEVYGTLGAKDKTHKKSKRPIVDLKDLEVQTDQSQNSMEIVPLPAQEKQEVVNPSV